MNLFTNGRGVFGNLGIYDFPFQMTWKELEIAGLFEFGSLQMEDVNYLQKGEKILSLLREKRPKYCFFKDNTLELIKDDWSKTSALAMRKIGAKLEQRFLQTLKDGMYSQKAYETACSELKNELSEQIVIKKEERSRELELVAVLCKEEQLSSINICLGDLDYVVPLGVSVAKKHENGCRLKGDEGAHIRVRMFRSIVAELYLREYLRKKLCELQKQSESIDDYLSHRVVGRILEMITGCSGTLNFADIKQWIKNHEDIDPLHVLFLFPESDEAKKVSLEISVYDLNAILNQFKSDYLKLKEEAKMEKTLSKDHARSFQTKKNIPRKCIRSMRRSGFNDYFGYVEFDEDCDLKLMQELYREYNAFSMELGVGKYPEVSLRFRKLGNHKASGLYYYTLKCLCVDVRSPGSMVHEVGHMIDYHLDHISIKYEFQRIFDRYESLLKDYVRNNKGNDTAILTGKTKYNLSYYLQPTEVFARCFEMYVVKCRNIDNSLCKPQGGFAYPEDAILLSSIQEFYDRILKKLEKEVISQEKS